MLQRTAIIVITRYLPTKSHIATEFEKKDKKKRPSKIMEEKKLQIARQLQRTQKVLDGLNTGYPRHPRQRASIAAASALKETRTYIGTLQILIRPQWWYSQLKTRSSTRQQKEINNMPETDTKRWDPAQFMAQLRISTLPIMIQWSISPNFFTIQLP